MNVHFSYKHTVKTRPVEKLISRRTEKLRRLLKTFSPELVHLHGTLERQSPRHGFVSSLNLRLPVGQVHAVKTGRSVPDSLRVAFDELERQLQKEKELLRGDPGKRRRAKEASAESAAPTAD